MKLKYYLITVLLLIGLSVTGQEEKKVNNEKEITEAVKPEKKNKNKQKEVKVEKGDKDDVVKTNEGNAYGKNKEELEGKEFGQERASKAKLEENEKQIKEKDQKVDKQNKKQKKQKKEKKEKKEKVEKE